MASTLEFEVRPESLAIARLAHDAPLPEWARGAFVTISRTPAELSVICDQRHVPPEVTSERDRVALGIVGVVPMTTVGLLASLCGALAGARVPVFVVSTYDTDWLLVQRAHLAAARAALEALGHSVRDSALS